MITACKSVSLTLPLRSLDKVRAFLSIARAVQAPQKGVVMRYVLLLLLLAVAGWGSDLGTNERAHGELQPTIFAAAFGSH